MDRPMTTEEKDRFHVLFPRLDVDRAIVTGEVSAVYNCISWTVGATDAWDWPTGSTLADFDDFYRLAGFVRDTAGTIAAWGLSSSEMRHGAVTGSGHGLRWESKCGDDLRIQHGLGELAGSEYGRVIAFYRRHGAPPAPHAVALEDSMKGKEGNPDMSTALQRTLSDQSEKVPQQVRTAFKDAFAAWKTTWFSGKLAVSSDPQTRAVGKEYEALVALGPAILPLIVEKLTDPENFLALQPYDAVQLNQNLLVRFGPGDERILEGEQGRAKRAVQLWFANQ